MLKNLFENRIQLLKNNTRKLWWSCQESRVNKLLIITVQKTSQDNLCFHLKVSANQSATSRLSDDNEIVALLLSFYDQSIKKNSHRRLPKISVCPTWANGDLGRRRLGQTATWANGDHSFLIEESIS